MDSLLSLLGVEFLHTQIWMWLVFLSIVAFLLIADLGILNKEDEEISMRKSLYLSAFYISIGVLFGFWVWWLLGAQKAVEYGTGFVIEKTLSMDNIFVIAMIFFYFQIPRKYQRRVLFWGILGVIFLRGVMIGFGAALVENFEWMLYIFGAFLVFTGIKMFFSNEEEKDMSENKTLKFLKKNFRTTDELHGNKFFIRKNAALYMTPLFTALVMVELADAIFAVDSIPAIFAITTDPYVIYTSNIFAILGIRALYFLLSAAVTKFTYLKHALSVVLVFIGSKIFIVWGAEHVLHIEDFHFPAILSLIMTVGIISIGVAASMYNLKKSK